MITQICYVSTEQGEMGKNLADGSAINYVRERY